MTNIMPIAIIGAGPYGLSVAAHLGARGLPFRIFGAPMSSWIRHMPKGMSLKSEGFASNLADPDGRFTLQRFCAEQGLEYRPRACPIPLTTMIDYGLAFQRQFAPEIEDRTVVCVEPTARGFRVALDDGETAEVRAVVVAVGIHHFRHMPVVLDGLPAELVTHAGDHHDLTDFAGREVAVIGGGASGVDLAVLLKEIGARVTLVHRRSELKVNAEPRTARSLGERLGAPDNGIGPGWATLFCAEAPNLFRHLPEHVRIRAVDRLIPPAAGWFMRNRLDGVTQVLGAWPQAAMLRDGRIGLQLTDGHGTRRDLPVDRVIAATGYQPDLDRLRFLGPEIRARLRQIKRAPLLSGGFQSSVPGLFFVGAISAYTFGPVVRFVFGAGFAARRVAQGLTEMGGAR